MANPPSPSTVHVVYEWPLAVLNSNRNTCFDPLWRVTRVSWLLLYVYVSSWVTSDKFLKNWPLLIVSYSIVSTSSNVVLLSCQYGHSIYSIKLSKFWWMRVILNILTVFSRNQNNPFLTIFPDQDILSSFAVLHSL